MNSSTIVIGVGLPIALVIEALLGFISFDLALSGITIMFSVALVPGVIENYRNKRGWSLQSTTMTASGLLSMSVIFLFLGLTLAGLSAILSGSLWVVLAIQSVIYAEPKTVAALVPHCATCNTIMKNAAGIGLYCPNDDCPEADGPLVLR